MTEPKLCPFFVLYALLKDTDVLVDAKTLSFHRCLQDKCAMWRIKYAMREKNDEGYCGLAGKP